MKTPARADILLRVPFEMKLRLQREAVIQKRSLNAEIVKRLEESFRDSYRL